MAGAVMLLRNRRRRARHRRRFKNLMAARCLAERDAGADGKDRHQSGIPPISIARERGTSPIDIGFVAACPPGETAERGLHRLVVHGGRCRRTARQRQEPVALDLGAKPIGRPSGRSSRNNSSSCAVGDVNSCGR